MSLLEVSKTVEAPESSMTDLSIEAEVIFKRRMSEKRKH